MNKLGTVALIGSPNVGKSTVFNRIVGKRTSIVDDQPGVTRDRLYAKCEWLGVHFSLIDTGGIEIVDRPFQEQIRAQAQIAIQEADVIVFIADAKIGLNSDDKYIARLLYKSGKPVILCVNKVDNIDRIADVSEFYALGLGDPLPLSGTHGVGIGDLLDKIIKLLPNNEEKHDDDIRRFSIIGRPNVGKSSLTNAILGNDRVIVSDISGTTRDSVNTQFVKDDIVYEVVDTAGINKRGQIYESVDKYALYRAMSAIDASDVSLFVIDADKGLTEQDKHVVSYAYEQNKGIIIVVNKWDLVEKNSHSMDKFTENLRKNLQFLSFAPIVFVSALKKSRMNTLFEALNVVFAAIEKEIRTPVLNEVLQDAQQMNEAPDFNGGRIRIYFGQQVGTKPPTIVLFCNNPKRMHFSYLRYIENRIRDSFDFSGTPINIVLRKRV